MKKKRKKNLPLLGAIHCVGKDSTGKKVYLPIFIPVKEDNKVLQGFNKKFKSLFNKSKKAKIVFPISAKDAKDITVEYMNRSLATLGQYKFKKGVWIKEAHPDAFVKEDGTKQKG